MTTDPKHHEQLTAANERIVKLTEAIRREEGRRDELLREQLDCEGCHDRRQSVR
jgi:hypothetical protein